MERWFGLVPDKEGNWRKHSVLGNAYKPADSIVTLDLDVWEQSFSLGILNWTRVRNLKHSSRRIEEVFFECCVHGNDELRLECQCCCCLFVREDEVGSAVQIGMATRGLLPAVKKDFTTA